ncbi:hypothetical protein [Tateyamaria sp. ANG-S1]|uniref:hypothetical protein n=1 Tax=Tateyamaria sp. ANG-S1 TaxID=1577905 RepID=UPI00126A5837|nr:hypothetical protein [Tateyamaria sp. ANG-S1]
MSLKSRFFRKLFAGAALAFGLCASGAHALTLDTFSGQLRGASDVNVGGSLYSVSFRDGSCFDLYSGCDEASDFAFSTAADAQAASLALLDQVFLNSSLGRFDTDPELTLGIESTQLGVILTPYQGDSFTALGYGAVNGNRRNNDGASALSFSATDVSTSSFFSYAVWTPNPSLAAVPLPPAVLMLLTALGGVFSMRFFGARRA